MNRVDFFYKQLVSEAQMDQAFGYAETADWNQNKDLGLVGITSGLAVSQHTPNNLTVDVASGVAYNKTGERISVGSTQVVNCAVDYNAVATTVASSGNGKWVSVFLQFDRALTDPQLDGNNLTVYYQRGESFKFKVYQSAESSAPGGIPVATRPALIADGILLADVIRLYGVTAITNTHIKTDRTEWMFQFDGGSMGKSDAKTALEALEFLAGQIDNHLTANDAHTAGDINYAGGPAWANGNTNPAATVEEQLDKILTDLANSTASNGGARRIGAESISGSPNSLSTGSIYNQLAALLGFDNALDAAVVKLAGSQTISGVKTFTPGLISSAQIALNTSSDSTPLISTDSIGATAKALLTTLVSGTESLTMWWIRQSLAGGAIPIGLAITNNLSIDNDDTPLSGSCPDAVADSWIIEISTNGIIFKQFNFPTAFTVYDLTAATYCKTTTRYANVYDDGYAAGDNKQTGINNWGENYRSGTLADGMKQLCAVTYTATAIDQDESVAVNFGQFLQAPVSITKTPIVTDTNVKTSYPDVSGVRNGNSQAVVFTVRSNGAGFTQSVRWVGVNLCNLKTGCSCTDAPVAKDRRNVLRKQRTYLHHPDLGTK